MNDHCRIGPFNLGAKTLKAFERPLAIHARREIVNHGCAFGYSSDHANAVADGFVAWHGRHAADSCGWLDFQPIDFNHYPQVSTVIDFA